VALEEGLTSSSTPGRLLGPMPKHHSTWCGGGGMRLQYSWNRPSHFLCHSG